MILIFYYYHNSEILEDRSNSEYIYWNKAGTSVIIRDVVAFSHIVLPKCKYYLNYYIIIIEKYFFVRKKILIKIFNSF